MLDKFSSKRSENRQRTGYGDWPGNAVKQRRRRGK